MNKKPRLLIIDANNWFRRKAETDIRGNPLRSCYTELQTIPFDEVMLVWDGFNARKTRRALYPEYKAKRNKPVEGFFEIQDTFKSLARLSKAISVEVPETEADDVIATLVKKFQNEREILIESNDADLLQLGVPMTRQDSTIPSGEISLFKTLVGDPSDNIKGIPGFGKTAWEKLETPDKVMFRLLVAGPDYSSAFGVIKGCPNVSDRVKTWLEDEENQKTLRIYWEVVNFIDVPYETVFKHMKFGLNRPDLAEGCLRDLFS